MIKQEDWVMIRNLFKQGLSKSEIAKRLGVTRKTVRRNLEKSTLPKYMRKELPSKLDRYKSYIEERLSKYNLSSYKLYEEVVKQGYRGKYGILNIFVRSKKKELKLSAVLRFETLPGEQAQVDWGFCGYIYDVEQRQLIKLYCFVIVLGFSRVKYVEFFTKQDTQSFLEGHNRAFKYFGGYSKEILYDNLKSVVIKRLFKAEDSELNKKFMDYAGYYGFKAILCRPYKPNTKGKVENSVNYVKSNFFAGEDFRSLREVNERVLEWLNKVNNRVHGTTKEKPIKRLERENLISVTNKDLYNLSETIYRKVCIDCHFSYKANFYSVPYEYAGKEIRVKVEGEEIVVSYRSDEIARHKPLKREKGVYVTKEEHLEGLKEQRYGFGKKKAPVVDKEKNTYGMYNRVNVENIEARNLQVYEGACL